MNKGREMNSPWTICLGRINTKIDLLDQVTVRVERGGGSLLGLGVEPSNQNFFEKVPLIDP